ncbi:hypothetical protein EOD39_3970 [Acipenser ruthenus]|uniref:Fork-head domain-containing protein n=1 Tax=Acipenser ruthenus TaxID=7906 RepID=A0A444UKG7_ACIRT|nr:hypothetical protein EOD39_3970 [Acipenser ruthenus]
MQPESKPRRKYRRYAKPRSTYLAMIAFVIQTSPKRSLTCPQIIVKLREFIGGESKGWANNVRVCLSSNECFIKVPLNPENPNGKKNFWRVDVNRIPPNALRRHLQGTMEIFPDLSPSQVASCKENAPPSGAVDAAQVTGDCAKKFNSPFSIESLLKKTCSAQPGPKLPSSFDITSGFCLRENHSFRNLYSQADSVGDGYTQAKQTNDLHYHGYPLPTPLHESRGAFHGYEERRVEANVDLSRQAQKRKRFSDSDYSCSSLEANILQIQETISPRCAKKTNLCRELPAYVFPSGVKVSVHHVNQFVNMDSCHHLTANLNSQLWNPFGHVDMQQYGRYIPRGVPVKTVKY